MTYTCICLEIDRALPHQCHVPALLCAANPTRCSEDLQPPVVRNVPAHSPEPFIPRPPLRKCNGASYRTPSTRLPRAGSRPVIVSATSFSPSSFPRYSVLALSFPAPHTPHYAPINCFSGPPLTHRAASRYRASTVHTRVRRASSCGRLLPTLRVVSEGLGWNKIMYFSIMVE